MNLVVASYAVAVLSVVLLAVHVRRRYPSSPERLPAQMGIDGRPSGRTIGKWFLWLPVAIIAAVVAVLGFALLAGEPGTHAAAEHPAVLPLVHLTIAYIAWLVAWTTDRQIAVARDPAIRYARIGVLSRVLPLLLLIAAMFVVAPPR